MQEQYLIDLGLKKSYSFYLYQHARQYKRLINHMPPCKALDIIRNKRKAMGLNNLFIATTIRNYLYLKMV